MTEDPFRISYLCFVIRPKHEAANLSPFFISPL